MMNRYTLLLFTLVVISQLPGKNTQGIGRLLSSYSLRIRNNLVDPNFEQTVIFVGFRTNLITSLTQVARANTGFGFAISYTGAGGFTVDRINAQSADTTNSWRVFRGSSQTPITTRLEQFIPANGDVITLDLVANPTPPPEEETNIAS